jgi:hypothetical protein
MKDVTGETPRRVSEKVVFPLKGSIVQCNLVDPERTIFGVVALSQRGYIERREVKRYLITLVIILFIVLDWAALHDILERRDIYRLVPGSEVKGWRLT